MTNNIDKRKLANKLLKLRKSLKLTLLGMSTKTGIPKNVLEELELGMYSKNNIIDIVETICKKTNTDNTFFEKCIIKSEKKDIKETKNGTKTKGQQFADKLFKRWGSNALRDLCDYFGTLVDLGYIDLKNPDIPDFAKESIIELFKPYIQERIEEEKRNKAKIEAILKEAKKNKKNIKKVKNNITKADISLLEKKFPKTKGLINQ
ncbi:hypothetical protein [Clostridium perfringens]|uniref:hypothetical protein n=1 Tax=Clostridium perfringens TaxID=1502 RepID=UPI0039E79600